MSWSAAVVRAVGVDALVFGAAAMTSVAAGSGDWLATAVAAAGWLLALGGMLTLAAHLVYYDLGPAAPRRRDHRPGGTDGGRTTSRRGCSGAGGQHPTRRQRPLRAPSSR